MTDDHILVSAPDFDWTGRARERALSCHLGKIYMVTDGRNAWHDTWVTRYRGWDGFATDLQTAKNRVEGMRVQGSTWAIKELPAVVISGKTTAAYLFEINSRSPLSRYTLDLRSTMTVRSMVGRVNATIRPRFMSRVGNAGQVGVADLQFRTHRSRTFGGNYLLGWNMRTHQLDLDGTAAIVAGVSTHLQKRLLAAAA